MMWQQRLTLAIERAVIVLDVITRIGVVVIACGFIAQKDRDIGVLQGRLNIRGDHLEQMIQVGRRAQRFSQVGDDLARVVCLSEESAVYHRSEVAPMQTSEEVVGYDTDDG